MLNSNEILDYLSKNKVRMQQEYHLVKIGLFGSVARNENNPSSDIDLIVEFEENTNDLFSLKRNLKNEIQSAFNVSVDICREKYIKPVFREQIIAEAKYV
jgi:predicted nucleotidyltransferase